MKRLGSAALLPILALLACDNASRLDTTTQPMPKGEAPAPAPAAAWSNKEHIQLTRIAASRLIADPATPEPMRQWLKAAVPDRPVYAEHNNPMRT